MSCVGIDCTSQQAMHQQATQPAYKKSKPNFPKTSSLLPILIAHLEDMSKWVNGNIFDFSMLINLSQVDKSHHAKCQAIWSRLKQAKKPIFVAQYLPETLMDVEIRDFFSSYKMPLRPFLRMITDDVLHISPTLLTISQLFHPQTAHQALLYAISRQGMYKPGENMMEFIKILLNNLGALEARDANNETVLMTAARRRLGESITKIFNDHLNLAQIKTLMQKLNSNNETALMIAERDLNQICEAGSKPGAKIDRYAFGRCIVTLEAILDQADKFKRLKWNWIGRRQALEALNRSDG